MRGFPPYRWDINLMSLIASPTAHISNDVWEEAGQARDNEDALCIYNWVQSYVELGLHYGK